MPNLAQSLDHANTALRSRQAADSLVGVSARTLLIGLILGLHLPAISLRAEPPRVQQQWPPTPPDIDVTTLSSGLRLIHLPNIPESGPPPADFPGEPVRGEIAFGYVLPPDPEAVSAERREIVRAWLERSVPARTIELIAHLGGGSFEVLDLPELIGFRVRFPTAFANTVLSEVGKFFGQVLEEDELLVYARRLVAEQRTASADLGMEDAVTRVASVLTADSGGGGTAAGLVSSQDEVSFFRGWLGTDRAWIVLSRPATSADRDVLGTLRPRLATSGLTFRDRTLPEGRDLELPSAREGGVVIGSRVDGVYYEAWFDAVVVDTALASSLPEQARTRFGPSRGVSVHLIMASVHFPDYAETVRGALLGEISRLGRSLPPAGELAAVKEHVLEYLGSRTTLTWFAAEDLWDPLEDGWSRVWNLTGENFRVAATAFAGGPRSTVRWEPAIETPAVTVESLVTASPLPGDEASEVLIAPGSIPIPALPPTPQAARSPVRVEKLASGMTLAEGSPAVFVSGPFPDELPGRERVSGTNGTLWLFDEIFPDDLAPRLAGVRPDRIVFFLPALEQERHRAALDAWSSGEMDATDAMGVGAVATADLPALVILKTWLDRKVIEAGWSGLVSVRIAGTEGSRIVIVADPVRKARVESWLASGASYFDSEAGALEFQQLGPASSAYYDRIRADLAILLSQRAPFGQILPPDAVSLGAFRNMLRIYF